MLAGLLFAIEDAEDRPQSLVATLPFNGATLIEYQARLLVAAGAGQLVIAVSRLTPELIGAINRIGRRGIGVDVVRSAVEAAAKLHPLARVLVLADGLVTTEPVLALIAGEGEDALLTVPAGEAGEGAERLGADSSWAGVARIATRRIVDVAAMPREYAFQSTLLRTALQAGAVRVLLPAALARGGHGIEHESAGLARRSQAALGAIVSRRADWFERWLVAPAARLLLPQLFARGLPSAAASACAAIVAVLAIVALLLRQSGVGLLVGVVALGLAAVATVFCWLRDEPQHARGLALGSAGFAVLCALLVARNAAVNRPDATPWVLAAAAIVAGLLAARAATPLSRRPWAGSAPAYLLLATPFAFAGWAAAGLGAVALYAALSCASGIERLRRQA